MYSTAMSLGGAYSPLYFQLVGVATPSSTFEEMDSGAVMYPLYVLLLTQIRPSMALVFPLGSVISTLISWSLDMLLVSVEK